ncbi:hypothetical protein PybrP1_005323 [[Pythium] brassicae (nom. inval.)]|nr:hypothetical protein PybrP1_005323 [[Pythium] brassicae (nom. inval.)]
MTKPATHFTRDLSLVLRHVRDAKRDHASDANEVGYYGPTAEKLVAIVHKLLDSTAELAPQKKYRLLLDFGDKFYAHREFRAASRFFYGKIVEAAGDDSRSSRDAVAVAETAGVPELTASEGEDGKLGKRRDPVVRHPGTLEKMLAALRLLQRGMEAATALELANSPLRCSWLVLNGSILIFSIARPLSTLGFAHEVVTFLKWSILSTESIVALSTTQYVLWRTQLYAATFECYELMAFQAAALNNTAREAQCFKAALSCAERALAAVTRLKKEEELDMPLPKGVIATLSQAQAIARMLVVRSKAVASHDSLSKREIEAALPSASVAERIRVAVDSIESLARSDKGCVGVLSPLPTQRFRLAAQVLRAILERIDRTRDELSLFDNHFDATTSPPSSEAQNSVALSCATLSCAVDHTLSHSDAARARSRGGGAASYRDQVGVVGTGSQFGSMRHDICCLYADLSLMLFQVELEEASAVDALPASTGLEARTAPFESLSLVQTFEEKLTVECRKNAYSKVLLLIQRMRHRPNQPRENTALADQALKLLDRVQVNERELQSRVKKAELRTAVTVRIVAFQPSLSSLRKRAVAYYMVFAKPSGAGTDVSLNNNALPGTAEPMYPSPRMEVTVSGLVPNESYVFAVAAFDSSNEVIQGIGQTTDAVVALHPLPVELCYGYLAQACYELGLQSSATKAATALYNVVVSRDAASRALWKANPFYRHALRRGVVAKLPIPILNLVVQAVLIRSHDEVGDVDRDGILYDPEHCSLLTRQVEVLEASRRIAIGVELASATANAEAIRALCFKGYRILLPLLHLHQCDGLTFAPLMMFYQALLTIPRGEWDVDTKSIFARVSFELLRIALATRPLSSAVYPSLVSETLQDHKEPQQRHAFATSNELESLCEMIAIQEALRMPGSEPTANSSQAAPPIAATKAPPVTKGASPPTEVGTTAAAAASSPELTPRQQGADKEPTLPPFKDLLQQANFSLPTALSTLETQIGSVAPSDVHQIEYVCKLAFVALQRGDESTAEACLAAAKLKGDMSTRFRAAVAAVGGECLLPVMVKARADDDEKPAPAAEAGTAPSTARSVKSPRQSENGARLKATTNEGSIKELSSANATASGPSVAGAANIVGDHVGRDDDFLFVWGGEVFFLQALVLYRRLVAMRSAEGNVDAVKGPAFNSAFALLHPTSDDSGGHSTSAPAEREMQNAFTQFLKKASAACEMFRCAKAWQALQATCQYVWNAVWLAWLSPDRFDDGTSASEANSSSGRLNRLVLCVDALLDMVETIMLAVKEQQRCMVAPCTTASQALPTTNSSFLPTSFTSTAVVASATSTMAADVAWMVSFVSFALQAFSAQERWELVVCVGSKFHALLGADDQGGGCRFSERNFPLLLYAQDQLLARASERLAAAEQELAAFVREFAEREAKKKKKKSRLVVEEVLTPEEVEFRARRASMEATNRDLAHTRDHLCNEMERLRADYDALTKSTNKCVQELDAVQELVETYRRGATHDAALPSQIVSAYSHCILLARQKRQQRLLCRAYQELGDFHLAAAGGSSGGVKLAVKSWLEALDNAFGALNVAQNWREALSRGARAHSANGASGAEQLKGDSFWVSLMSCTALSKLILHAAGANCFQALEYALMAAKVFTRLFACSLPHPTREFQFGSYELGRELWPGRELLAAERVAPLMLAVALLLVPEVLLQHEHYAVSAMSVIAGYEHLARYTLESASHVANARRLRVEGLSQCGRIREALNALCRLVDGVDAASTREQLAPTGLLAPVAYDDSKPLRDGANAGSLAWFAAIPVDKVHAELSRTKPAALVLEILVTVLRVVVRLSCHESNLADGSSPLRVVADKMALALLQLAAQSSSAASTESATTPSMAWDSAHIASVRSEIVLLQSRLAYSDGQWKAANELGTKALELSQQRMSGTGDGGGVVASLDLDQRLPFCLFRRPSAFAAKCRLQLMQCDLALGRFHALLAQSEIALLECRESGEELVAEQLVALRCEALVLTGQCDAAERELEQLRAAATARRTNCSLPFAQALLLLGTVLRARALLTADRALLRTVWDRVTEAEQVVDELLERNGWIGVACKLSEPRAGKRLNVYHPAIASFVLVKADLAQTLVECDLIGASETVTQRQNQVLRIVDEGLRAARHTTRRVGGATARLLLLKGSTLKKKLLSSHVGRVRHQNGGSRHGDSSGDSNDDTATSEIMDGDGRVFDDAVASLTASIETSMQSGGYDRRLMRAALIELVDLYGCKLVAGKANEHVQAAFHYLCLAAATQRHEFVLFETLELQGGTLTVVPDTLPPFLSHTLSESTPATSTPSPDAKKGEPAPKKVALDTARLVNWYVRLQREQHALPAHGAAQQDAVQWLHTFLLQHHSSYATSCCLPALPAIPPDDPEIKASLVCAHWGRDLTPALSVVEVSGAALSGLVHAGGAAATLTLYFTLGTTRIDIQCADSCVDAATRRVEGFLRAPLLSSKTGLDEAEVGSVRSSLSHLRTQLEDDESLVLDRGAFESAFKHILARVQRLLCPSRASPSLSEQSDDSAWDADTQDPTSPVRDAFGNPIPLQCALDTVRSLKNLFTVTSGVNIADNLLCYFLRDLLEPQETT